MKQLGRFLIVGASNFALSFTVFYLLYEHWPLSELDYLARGPAASSLAALARSLGIDSADAAAANVVGYSAGIVNSFLWNRSWTFQTTDRPFGRLRRFAALNLACLVASSASLFVFTDYLGWPYQPVWLLTMTAVTAANFALSRGWVFK